MRKIWFVFFASLLAADVLTKALVSASVPMMGPFDRVYPFGGIGIFSDLFGVSFSINYVINTGAAWGIFSGNSGLLFALRSAIILGMFAYLLFSKAKGTPKIPLWIVAIGALGNAIDYCVYGHVVDFLHFTFGGHSFPLFNIADSCITLGVLGLLVFSRSGKKQMQTL